MKRFENICEMVASWYATVGNALNVFHVRPEQSVVLRCPQKSRSPKAGTAWTTVRPCSSSFLRLFLVFSLPRLAPMGVLAAPSPRTAVLACGAATMGVFGTLFSSGYRFTGYHGDFGM